MEYAFHSLIIAISLAVVLSVFWWGEKLDGFTVISIYNLALWADLYVMAQHT